MSEQQTPEPKCPKAPRNKVLPHVLRGCLLPAMKAMHAAEAEVMQKIRGTDAATLEDCCLDALDTIAERPESEDATLAKEFLRLMGRGVEMVPRTCVEKVVSLMHAAALGWRFVRKSKSRVEFIQECEPYPLEQLEREMVEAAITRALTESETIDSVSGRKKHGNGS